jgi:hypothetical protein
VGGRRRKKREGKEAGRKKRKKNGEDVGVQCNQQTENNPFFSSLTTTMSSASQVDLATMPED